MGPEIQVEEFQPEELASINVLQADHTSIGVNAIGEVGKSNSGAMTCVNSGTEVC